MSLVRMSVRWSPIRYCGWIVMVGRRTVISVEDSKPVAIRVAKAYGKEKYPGGVSIRIYNKNGRLSKNGELTFPRSADPRRSKG